MKGRPNIRHDCRGATMVFGIFFALFLVACVYRIHGIAEVIRYRQHQQDAADASAFAGAVMNARGMNLLALINMTMAAVLAVYVGLRMAQTLVIVGIALCTALSTVTMGASMTYVPALTQSTVTLEKAITKVGKKLPKLLSALHTAGKAVSVVVPLGANTRVIQVAVGQYDQTAAFGIPGRIALPVEDGKFIDLCMHAGTLVGDIAFSPVSLIVGEGAVKNALSEAVGKLTSAAPGWFCGQNEASKPDLDPGGATDSYELPLLPQQKLCAELSAKAPQGAASAGAQQQLEQVCAKAVVEYMASTPSRTGEARSNEPLCPMDCKINPRSTCPPVGTELCDAAQKARIDELALLAGESTAVDAGPNSPFMRRVVLAHQQCDPSAARKHPLGGFSWTEALMIRRYEWMSDGAGGAHKVVKLDPTRPKQLMTRSDDDSSHPCGAGGFLSEIYETDPNTVCEGTPFCSDALGNALSNEQKPCDRTSPEAGGMAAFYEATPKVVSILRCVERRPHKKIETPDVNMEAELESQSSGENTSPFQLQTDVWLGGSDFQFRVATLGKEVSLVADAAVKLVAPQKAHTAGVRKVAAGLARVAVSQGEFFFDLRAFPDLSDQTEEADRLEWLWSQGWVARLRPFRLWHGRADGPRKAQPAIDSEQAVYADGAEPPAQDLSACPWDVCDELKPLLEASNP